jgi:alpha-L-rhamnosidase
MNSYNHYAYGAVCQWLFEGLAGFRPDPSIPGFRNIIFEPTIVPELSPVAATYDSVAGRIEASWSVEGDRVTYRIVIPESSRGTLVLSPHYSDIRVDGQAIGWSGGAEPTRSLLEPGTHAVTFRHSHSNGGSANTNASASAGP